MVSVIRLDQVAEQFARDGYVVLRGALPAELCSNYGEAVIGEYQRLGDAGWRFASSGSLAGHLRVTLGPGGYDLLSALETAGVPQLVGSLCAEPMALAEASGNLNLPGSVHQDFHIDGRFAERLVIANVCLVATDDRNGATELVPASHLTDLSYWRFRADHWPRRALRPVLEPGDVLLRPSTLWHRGTPNRCAVPRPMAAFVWGALARVDPREAERHLAEPLTISGNKFYGRWRRAKEFAAVRLPWIDDALRLGRSWLVERAKR